MIEEETAARISVLIEQRVQEVMSSDAVQDSLNARLTAERKDLEDQVQLRAAMLKAGLQPAFCSSSTAQYSN